MRYRIIERRQTVINGDHPNGEFGKVHKSTKWYAVETMTLTPKTVKTFRSFSAAEKWCKRNKYEIGEVI